MHSAYSYAFCGVTPDITADTIGKIYFTKIVQSSHSTKKQTTKIGPMHGGISSQRCGDILSKISTFNKNL